MGALFLDAEDEPPRPQRRRKPLRQRRRLQPAVKQRLLRQPQQLKQQQPRQLPTDAHFGVAIKRRLQGYQQTDDVCPADPEFTAALARCRKNWMLMDGAVLNDSQSAWFEASRRNEPHLKRLMKLLLNQPLLRIKPKRRK